MFAVIKTGGKQYRVAADDVIKVEKVNGEPGDIVEFGEVLVVGGDDVEARRARLFSGATRRRPRCWSRAAARRSSPSRSAAARIRAASAATARSSPWSGSPRS